MRGDGLSDVRRRCRGATEESINDGAQAKQLVERCEARRRRVLAAGARGGSVVSPVRRDQGPTAIGQDQDPMLAVVSMRPSQDG